MNGAILTLNEGPWQAEARPEQGGRLARLVYDGQSLLVPMGQGEFDPVNWSKAGAYPLIPFHNRVPGAQFTWRGRDVRLPVHPSSVPNALHGHGSRMVWQGKASKAELRMTFENSVAAYWPWRFRALQSYRFFRNRMELDLEITNLDDAAMPAGLGWHPYFQGGTRLSDDASHGWHVGSDRLSQGKRVTRDAVSGETLYLTGWTTVFAAVPSGLNLRITASKALQHLVIYAPDGAGFACAEPVSHPVAAMAAGPGGGMHELPPGASLAARITLAVETM
ncbi:aldose 1-epimerase [Paracoccus saliphilus]|uniref:Aldose 1-epimerase n=1 Tax=Paracoccus saliphilus TaxID=405559 RepID=A0AA45W2N7_9RHOB|nr:aldose 1-epimerase [Paracoccus saliphilus]